MPDPGKVIPLTKLQRLSAALLAALLLGVAAWVYLKPPSRTTTEMNEVGLTKTSTAPADSTAVAITICSVGLASAIFAVNGAQITRFSAAGLEVEAKGNSAEASKESAGDKEAVVALLGAELNKRNAQWTTFVENFYQLSSWNGKRVLFACYLCERTGKPFNLSKMCEEDKRITFDYAYGFLIGAMCGGFVGATLTDFGTRVIKAAFLPVQAEFLIKHIKGQLDGDLKEHPERLRELELIAARFGELLGKYGLP